MPREGEGSQQGHQQGDQEEDQEGDQEGDPGVAMQRGDPTPTEGATGAAFGAELPSPRADLVRVRVRVSVARMSPRLTL